MTDKPKILVTGVAGLLGSRLASLAADRFEIVRADVAEGIDITDHGQIARLAADHADARAMIHLAAFTDVSAAHAQTGDEEGDCFRVNVVGTHNVASACHDAGIHLIAVSTDFVFDGAKDEPWTEADEPDPIEWYGRTKWLGEQAVREARAWTLIRIAFPYAAGPAPRNDLVRNIHDRLASGGEARLFTDQTITPTFIDDIAEGLLLLARERPAGEAFHLVGSSWVTPFELGTQIAETFGFDRDLVRPSSLAEHLKTDPRPRQRSLRMSNEKWSAFAREHGLEKPVAIEEGLARVKAAMA